MILIRHCKHLLVVVYNFLSRNNFWGAGGQGGLETVQQLHYYYYYY